MASFAALSPYHDHHTTCQMTDRDDPFFRVVETVINDIQGPTVENDSGVLEGKTALFEGLASLSRHIVP